MHCTVGIVILHVGVPKIKDESPLTLTTDMYNSKIHNNILPTRYSNATYFESKTGLYHQEKVLSLFPTAHNLPVIAENNCTTIRCISQDIYDHMSDFEASAFGAYSISNIKVYYYNSSFKCM